MTWNWPPHDGPIKHHPVLAAERPDKSPSAGGRSNAVDRDRERLQQACADFEALFIQKLFQTMRAAIPKSGLIDSGPAKDIYTAMLDQQVARDLSLQGGLGLSNQIKAQIIRYVEPSGNPED